jgi:hypothetical protein
MRGLVDPRGGKDHRLERRVRENCQRGLEGGGIETNQFLLPYHGRRPARGRGCWPGDQSHAEDGSLAIEDTGEGTSATQKMPPRVPGRSLWDQSDTEHGLVAVGATLAGGVGWNAMV